MKNSLDVSSHTHLPLLPTIFRGNTQEVTHYGHEDMKIFVLIVISRRFNREFGRKGSFLGDCSDSDFFWQFNITMDLRYSNLPFFQPHDL